MCVLYQIIPSLSYLFTWHDSVQIVSQREGIWLLCATPAQKAWTASIEDMSNSRVLASYNLPGLREETPFNLALATQ